MVHKFDTIDIKTCNPFELSISEGDTIILGFDQDIWDIAEAEALAKVWVEAYPHNSIAVTFKGMEVKGIVHQK